MAVAAENARGVGPPLRSDSEIERTFPINVVSVHSLLPLISTSSLVRRVSVSNQREEGEQRPVSTSCATPIE